MPTRSPAIVMLAALGGAALVFVVISAGMLAFWYPIDPGEGVLLDEVMRLSRGESIFEPITSPPYYLSNYPPLFVLLQVPFAWMWGPDLWYGRLISQMSAVAAAALIGGAVFRLSGDRLAAWAGGLMLLAVPIVVFWSQVTRVDLLALALGWGGIYLAFDPRRRRVAASAACVIAAGYTRQTAWLPPLAAIIAYMLTTPGSSGRRDAGMFALTVGLSGLALMAAFHIATGGWFEYHVLGLRSDPWELSRLLPGFQYVAVQLAFALPLAAATIGLGVVTRRPWAPPATAYFAAAVVMGALVVKRGSHINYFIELGAATAMLCGMAVAARRAHPWLGLASMLLLTIQSFWTVRVEGTFQPQAPSGLHVLRDKIRAAGDSVISDVGLGLVPLAGRRLYFDPFTMALARDSGRWDAARVMRDIRERRVSLIAVLRTRDGSFPHWPPDLIRLIEDAYRDCGHLPLDDGTGGTVTLFRPVCPPGEAAGRMR